MLELVCATETFRTRQQMNYISHPEPYTLSQHLRMVLSQNKLNFRQTVRAHRLMPVRSKAV